MRNIDTSAIKLRRRHKTVVRMYRHGTTSSNSSSNSEETSDSSSERLERQDAMDQYTTSGDDSRIYSAVKYKTGKQDSWNGTVYESFVDHGEGAGEICYQPLHDSISSFCFITECESPTRESFMIGSTPSRCAGNEKKDSFDGVIHLSTAKMNLLEIKQKSEQSQNSSFEHKLSGEKWKNMAYEDLLNIDGESMKPKIESSQKMPQDKHHSMPNQFVGNRFNVSSLTEIFIPSCKNQSEHSRNQIATPCNSFEEPMPDNVQSQTSHSSSMNFQERAELTLPAPDKITAEILYNISELDDNNEACRDNNERLSNEAEIFYSTKSKRCDSEFLPPATTYSSDSDSGIAAGSYTLSPSDQPFRLHRSFISNKFNPLAVSSSSQHFVSNDPTNVQNITFPHPFLHNDSSEGENKSKLIINVESGLKEGTSNVYYSGLYAHWWKKEKLPIQVIEALINPNDDDDCKRGDRGSGKKKKIMLKIKF